MFHNKTGYLLSEKAGKVSSTLIAGVNTSAVSNTAKTNTLKSYAALYLHCDKTF